MFPCQPDEHVRSWNNHMRDWPYCRIATQRDRTMKPREWCTACRLDWQCRGWWCHLCGRSSTLGIFLVADSPRGYSHYDVRRACRFLEHPGCSDIYVRASDHTWQYKSKWLRPPCSCQLGWDCPTVRPWFQIEQDYLAREWLAEVHTLLMSEFHPFPGEHINAPGPLASKRLLSWLLYLRPFVLMSVHVPTPPVQFYGVGYQRLKRIHPRYLWR